MLLVPTSQRPSWELGLVLSLPLSDRVFAKRLLDFDLGLAKAYDDPITRPKVRKLEILCLLHLLRPLLRVGDANH